MLKEQEEELLPVTGYSLGALEAAAGRNVGSEKWNNTFTTGDVMERKRPKSLFWLVENLGKEVWI